MVHTIVGCPVLQPTCPGTALIVFYKNIRYAAIKGISGVGPLIKSLLFDCTLHIKIERKMYFSKSVNFTYFCGDIVLIIRIISNSQSKAGYVLIKAYAFLLSRILQEFSRHDDRSSYCGCSCSLFGTPIHRCLLLRQLLRRTCLILCCVFRLLFL